MGAGAEFYSSSPTITGCVVVANTAHEGGGVYSVVNAAPTLTNCTMTVDTAAFDGGDCNSTPALTNCILWGDAPNEINDSIDPVVTYCDRGLVGRHR